jgi:hypothetical protein
MKMKTKSAASPAAMRWDIALEIFYAEDPAGKKGVVSIRVAGGRKHQQRREGIPTTVFISFNIYSADFS